MIIRQSVLTLEDLQNRLAEPTGIQQLEPQAQLQTRPASPTPPPPGASPNPIEAALYGVAGLAVRALQGPT